MQPYTHDELRGIMNGLFDESDRGCVLIGAAWVEDCLDKLLRATFKRMSGIGNKELDKLLSFEEKNPTLGAATARVKVAEAMGLFNLQIGKSIRGLFNYRNASAHWRKGLSFGVPKDADANKSLKLFIENAPKPPVGLDDIIKSRKRKSGEWPERTEFIASVVNVAATLMLIKVIHINE